MDRPKRLGVVILALVAVISTLALSSNALVGYARAYSGSTSASPNPASSTQSVTVYCSWSAYQRSGYGWTTVYCKIDGVTWYSNNIASGSVNKVFAPGYFSTGSHTLEVDYSTGLVSCGHAPCYSFAKVTATLTVNCIPNTISLAFWIFPNAGQSLNFGGHAYTNGQSVSVGGACGQKYSIQVWYLNGYNFYEWATDTDGVFTSTSLSHSRSNPDTFSAGSHSGNIVMVVDDWGTPSVWGGYTAYSASSSFNSVSTQFQIPTSITYYPWGGGRTDEVAYWVGLGGFWANPFTNFWQAGIILTMTSGGTITITPFYEQCYAPDGHCDPPQTPWSYRASPGDYIYMSVLYAPPPNEYSACIIEDLGNPPGAAKWYVSTASTPPCKVANYHPDQSTAEWIGEIPISSIGGAGPNIGPVTFTGLSPYWATALDNSIERPPDATCPQQMAAGDISGTGSTSQFTVTYSNLGGC